MSEKKEQIINTAIELFAERGFEGTSIRELATKADVNVAMVNYYFGSKDKLFEAIVEHKAIFMRGKLDEIATNPRLDALGKIDAVIESYVEKILTQPSFHKILYQELMMEERESMHNAIIRIFSRNTETIKNIIEQGIRKKQFKKVDVSLTLATLMGTINQVMLSKAMCTLLVDGEKNFNPYKNPAFKIRLIKHIKQVMHAHLLPA